MKQSLATLRRANNLTQRQLAAELGISPSSIALYELGLRTPSLQTASKIAKYFNISLDEMSHLVSAGSRDCRMKVNKADDAYPAT